MRIILFASILLLLPLPGYADDQPFADYSQLLAAHADEVTVRTILNKTGRMLDLGDGVRIYCEGTEGATCGLLRDPVKASVDMPCSADMEASVIFLAQCPGVVSAEVAVQSSENLDKIAAYIAQNAVPAQGQAKVRAAALAAVEREFGSEFETSDLCIELQDEDSQGWKMMDATLGTTHNPEYMAHLRTDLATPRPVLTFCGDKFEALGN